MQNAQVTLPGVRNILLEAGCLRLRLEFTHAFGFKMLLAILMVLTHSTIDFLLKPSLRGRILLMAAWRGIDGSPAWSCVVAGRRHNSRERYR
jgi:hypothetical protein